MVAGAVVAGCSDLTFSLPGYLWMGILIFSTATYLLLIKLLGDKAGASRCVEVPAAVCGSTCRCVLLTELLRVHIIHEGMHTGLNQTTLLWHNNVLGLPIMLLYLVGGTNEIKAVASYPQLTSVWFWVRRDHGAAS